MDNEKIFLTEFLCDRCKKENALRIKLAIKKDSNGKKTFEEIDLCLYCIIQLCAFLFQKIDWDKKESWIHSFLANIIG